MGPLFSFQTTPFTSCNSITISKSHTMPRPNTRSQSRRTRSTQPTLPSRSSLRQSTVDGSPPLPQTVQSLTGTISNIASATDLPLLIHFPEPNAAAPLPDTPLSAGEPPAAPLPETPLSTGQVSTGRLTPTAENINLAAVEEDNAPTILRQAAPITRSPIIIGRMQIDDWVFSLLRPNRDQPAAYFDRPVSLYVTPPDDFEYPLWSATSPEQVWRAHSLRGECRMLMLHPAPAGIAGFLAASHLQAYTITFLLELDSRRPRTVPPAFPYDPCCLITLVPAEWSPMETLYGLCWEICFDGHIQARPCTDWDVPGISHYSINAVGYLDDEDVEGAHVDGCRMYP